MAELGTVIRNLAENATRWRAVGDWPEESLTACGRHGVFSSLSGWPEGRWDATEKLNAFVEMARHDLVTTFVITQHLAGLKQFCRVARGNDHAGAAEMADAGAKGIKMMSVGISHLTTSRRHLAKPAVQADLVDGGIRVSGTVPWVTGASRVACVVVGAELSDGRQVLFGLDPQADGVNAGPGAEMLGMSASCTDQIRLEDVFVEESSVLAGPQENVLAGGGGGTGGLTTSALAIGHSRAALDYLRSESERRPQLAPIVERFEEEHARLRRDLLSAGRDEGTFQNADLRARANSLVDRTTSAAMTAAKGAGLMADHPVARLCTQALFFLVWSCPQDVAQTHLCELSGGSW